MGSEEQRDKLRRTIVSHTLVLCTSLGTTAAQTAQGCWLHTALPAEGPQGDPGIPAMRLSAVRQDKSAPGRAGGSAAASHARLCQPRGAAALCPRLTGLTPAWNGRAVPQDVSGAASC